ncbi:protein prenylyltransferase [Auriculariales sp. MPI-PUGE-AT-0066]|nr:protein prenylyltransferase [Auriculariales sp. MPI-PUGE-AT-0066]
MRQSHNHASRSDDDPDRVTLQEGPRSPPTLSTETARWGSPFQAVMTSSPASTPLLGVESPVVGLSGIVNSVPIGASVETNSTTSPATSLFSNSSGTTSVSSWTSDSRFPFLQHAEEERERPEVTARGFSSDPGRVTASVISDNSSFEGRRNATASQPSTFNTQPPLPQDFLSPDAPLRAQRAQHTQPPARATRPNLYDRAWQSQLADSLRTQQALSVSSRTHSAPSLHVPPSVEASPLATSAARDSLLSYAHQLYLSASSSMSSGPAAMSAVPLVATTPSQAHSQRSLLKTQLLPLLSGLRTMHPRHTPTLLLYGCVLHALEDHEASLAVNQEILTIDPDFPEAMCNLGTTLRALHQHREAEEWWWKAIILRPVYWDAVDNLMGVLSETPAHAPRFDLALALCAYVCAHIAPTQLPAGALGRLRHQVNETIFVGMNYGQVHPQQLYTIAPQQLHKLQNLLFQAANLRSILRVESHAVSDHLHIINIAIRPFQFTDTAASELNSSAYTTQCVLLALCIIGLLMTSTRDAPAVSAIVTALGLVDVSQLTLLFNEHGQSPDVIAGQQPVGSHRVNLIEVVYASLDRLKQAVVNIGGGILPVILLLPSQAAKLPSLLFGASRGSLPSVGALHSDADLRRVTATVLLSLAKLYQDGDAPGNALLCFYLALGLRATPNAYNNAGLLLRSLGASHSSLVTDENGHSRVVDGFGLARAFYVNGLALDSQHPHLLTNLGSLMKEQGQTTEAIQVYARALKMRPDFDVALANMATAVRDMGRIGDAIDYYRRAIEVSPDFLEALCGYVSALNAVCDWRGRGALSGPVQEHLYARFEPFVDDSGALCWLAHDAPISHGRGLMARVVEACEEQLKQAYSYGVGVMRNMATPHGWMDMVERALNRRLVGETRVRWRKNIDRFFDPGVDRKEKAISEGAFVLTLVSYFSRVVQRRWFVDAYGVRPYVPEGQPIPPPASANLSPEGTKLYQRPPIPVALGPPPTPSVLPFHAFTYPLSVRTTRLLSYRNGLRITHMCLTQPWLPSHVYPPPPPLRGKLNIGYISGDLHNHPLAHLTQSVFGFHDLTQFSVYVYATSPSDNSIYRRKIERESQHFTDCSSWSTAKLVDKIVSDGIHVLINLGGYTKGCRNEVLAARPAPVQMSMMGFAGTLCTGWSDYVVTDVVACPPETNALERWRQRRARGEETSRIQDHLMELDRETDMDVRPDPESLSEDWTYGEKFIYMPYSYFVNDHKQSYRRDDLPHDAAPSVHTNDPDHLWALETARRQRLRQVIFPDLPETTIIFANFNQLYKIDPVIFATWLRVLKEVPNSILWLLRFPALGAENLIRTARLWAGDDLAARIRFTDVAPKERHIQRGRVADLFLDTVECNAHTTATDILWSGTPILTWPKYKHKMCTRVGASVARATGFGSQMIVGSLAEYQARAIALARMPAELYALRKALYLGRWDSPLFDTRGWVRYLEVGIREAWRRWVEGTEFEDSDEWAACKGPEFDSGSIWIDTDGRVVHPPKDFMT